jgi:hypothetical protein
MLKVMMEEKREMNVTKMEFLERGHVAYLEQENRRLCVEEEKI